MDGAPENPDDIHKLFKGMKAQLNVIWIEKHGMPPIAEQLLIAQLTLKLCAELRGTPATHSIFAAQRLKFEADCQ